jgi:dephospho-CoA kinase
VLIAGLTGGMACGKSFVAKELGRLGAHVIEADELGREAVQAGTEAYAEVVAAFGNGILNAENQIDRAALAARVFDNPDLLGRLNAIVHPAVRKMAKRQISMISTAEPNAVVVYVAAILIESGGDKDVEKIIVVACDEKRQLERALERGGARENVLARLKHQLPLAEKMAKSDYVIDTNGTKEETLRQTKMVYDELRRLAQTS